MSEKKQPKTLEELYAERDKLLKQLQQVENREKILRQRVSSEERKERTHRLCARGGYMESVVPELIEMTEEEAKGYLLCAASSQEAQDYLKKWREGQA